VSVRTHSLYSPRPSRKKKMNERIKALVEQARKYADENRPGSFVKYDPEWFVLYNEKFAELIVKECLKELKDMIVDESELLYPNNKQTTEFVNDRLLDAYDNIKEHFGVEE
jgi:hypothetical protein